MGEDREVEKEKERMKSKKIDDAYVNHLKLVKV